MARHHPHFATISTGTTPLQIGYAALRRGGGWAVVYIGPSGRRIERMTRSEVRGTRPGPDFHTEAVGIIAASYRPENEADTFSVTASPTWTDSVTEVAARFPNIRAETMRSYRAAIHALTTTVPDCDSPCRLSEYRVEQFAQRWLAAKKRNGKPRSPTTLSYYMRALSSLTNHLIKLSVMSKGGNLFRGYTVPAGERSQKKSCPTEDQIAQFFGYVETRYPTWHTLRTLLAVKAVSACRTADLCQLRTSSLTATGIVFTASSSKTKTARALPLASELADQLRAGAGPVWIWQGFFDDVKKYRRQSNGTPETYSVKTVEFVLINIFREYSDAHPDQPRLTPHAFRRRGITQAVRALGGRIDAAAAAIGVHPQTARRHYLDDAEAYQTEETMRKLAEVLTPKFAKSKS